MFGGPWFSLTSHQPTQRAPADKHGNALHTFALRSSDVQNKNTQRRFIHYIQVYRCRYWHRQYLLILDSLYQQSQSISDRSTWMQLFKKKSPLSMLLISIQSWCASRVSVVSVVSVQLLLFPPLLPTLNKIIVGVNIAAKIRR